MNRVNGVRYLLRNRRRHVDLGRSGACILMSSAASPPVSPVHLNQHLLPLNDKILH